MTDKTTPVVEQQGRWLKIAKAAGDHGVRYRTNRALEAFMGEVGDEFPAKADALDEKAIRFDERKKIIGEGCIHTRKAAEQDGNGERADIVQWQTDQSEWFDPTICEIVSEYAAWRDAQSTPEQPSGEPVLAAWPEPKFVPMGDSGQMLNPERAKAAYQAIKMGLTIGEQFNLVAMVLDGTDFTVVGQSPTPASPSLDEYLDGSRAPDRIFLLSFEHVGETQWSSEDDEDARERVEYVRAALSAPASATSERDV